MHINHKLLGVAVFVVAAGGIVPGISFAQVQPQVTVQSPSIDQLKAEIVTLEAEVAALQSEMSAQAGVVLGASTSTQASITVSADPAEALASSDMMGSTNNSLATFRVAETSDVENVAVTDMTVSDIVISTTGVKPSFTNITLWNGSTLLGTALTSTVRGSSYIYTFHFANPVMIPAGNSVSLTLHGDVPSYVTGAATDNSVHTFKIVQTSDITAHGVTSNRKTTVVLQAPKGNPMTVLRSMLTLSAVSQGIYQGRLKSTVDQLGTVIFWVNPAGPVAANTLIINFAGSAVAQGGSAFMKSVQLIDQNGVNITSEGAKKTIASSTIQWTWASGAGGWALSGGTTDNLALQVNSALIPSVASGTSQTLVANIVDPSDLSYTDGLDTNATQKLHLSPSTLPITINAVNYLNGTAPVPTAAISVNPTVINAGQSTALSWSSTNATVCTILGTNGYNDNGPWSWGDLAPSGSMSVTPYPYASSSYVALYQINCSGLGGTSITTSTGLSVYVGSTGGKLTASGNSAVPLQTVAAGATNQRVGSFSLTASYTEGVNVTSMSFVPNVPYFQNLRLMVNGVQFGTTQPTVTQGANYTFSGTPFTVPAGTTVNVDVYTDILSSAATSSPSATTLTGCVGSGTVASDSLMCNAPVAGQGLVIASGPPTLIVAADQNQVPAGDVVMGSTGNVLSSILFANESGATENIKVMGVTITDTVASSGAQAAFSNVQLWNGSTLLGTAGAPYTRASTTFGFEYQIPLTTPAIVPQGGWIRLTVRGDAATYASHAATDNSPHAFGIVQSNDVQALGASSNKAAVVVVNGAGGNPQTVLRTVVTANTSPLGATTGRSKGNPDDFGYITLTANAAGQAAVNKITVTFSGSAASAPGKPLMSASNISLVDSNGNTVTSTTYPGSTETVNPSTLQATWTFPTGNGSYGFQLVAGESYSFKLRLNTTVVPPEAGIAETLSAAIRGLNDVAWTDGLDAQANSGLPLSPNTVVPIIINSVTYAPGN